VDGRTVPVGAGASASIFRFVLRAKVPRSQDSGGLGAEGSCRTAFCGHIHDRVNARGPAPVKVVSYKNKPFADAEAFYKNAGLIVQRAEDKFHDTIATGNVISSDPKTGAVPKGGTITFTVSKGPELIQIPNVRGLPSAAAKKKLTALKFKVQVKRVSFFGETAWGTNPGEGQQAPKGSTVTLYIG